MTLNLTLVYFYLVRFSTFMNLWRHFLSEFEDTLKIRIRHSQLICCVRRLEDFFIKSNAPGSPSRNRERQGGKASRPKIPGSKWFLIVLCGEFSKKVGGVLCRRFLLPYSSDLVISFGVYFDRNQREQVVPFISSNSNRSIGARLLLSIDSFYYSQQLRGKPNRIRRSGGISHFPETTQSLCSRRLLF